MFRERTWRFSGFFLRKKQETVRTVWESRTAADYVHRLPVWFWLNLLLLPHKSKFSQTLQAFLPPPALVCPGLLDSIIKGSLWSNSGLPADCSLLFQKTSEFTHSSSFCSTNGPLAPQLPSVMSSFRLRLQPTLQGDESRPRAQHPETVGCSNQSKQINSETTGKNGKSATIPEKLQLLPVKRQNNKLRMFWRKSFIGRRISWLHLVDGNSATFLVFHFISDLIYFFVCTEFIVLKKWINIWNEIICLLNVFSSLGLCRIGNNLLKHQLPISHKKDESW